MKKLALLLAFILGIVNMTVSAAGPTPSLPDNSQEISYQPGAFTVTFDSAVDNALVEGITLKDAAGKEVRGGIYPVVSEDKKTVTVKYGMLESSSEYTLSVAGTTTTYTTKDPILFEDFSDENLANATEQEYDKTRYFVSAANNKIMYFPGIADTLGEVVSLETAEYNNDKYIRLASHKGDEKVDTTLSLYFLKAGGAVTDPVVVTEVKLRPAAEANAENYRTRDIMTTYLQGNSAKIRVADFNKTVGNDGVRTVKDSTLSNAKTRGKDPGYMFTKDGADENGFLTYVFVYSRDAENKYTVSMYNKNNLSEGYYVLETGISGTGISRLVPGHVTTWSPGGDTYFDISELKVEVGEPTDVLYTNVANLGRDKNEFFVAFTNDMDAEAAKNLVLKDSAGKEVKIAFKGLEAGNRRATYALYEYLNDEEDYTFDLSSVLDFRGLYLKNEEYEFTAPKTIMAEIVSGSEKVTDGTTEIMGTELGAATKVVMKSKAKNTGANAADFVLAAVVYDSDGRIVKMYIDTTQKNIAPGGTTAEMSVDTTGTELLDGYKVEKHMWKIDKVDTTGPVSIIEPCVYTK